MSRLISIFQIHTTFVRISISAKILCSALVVLLYTYIFYSTTVFEIGGLFRDDPGVICPNQYFLYRIYWHFVPSLELLDRNGSDEWPQHIFYSGSGKR